MANDAFGNPLPTAPTAAPGSVTTPAVAATDTTPAVPQTTTPGFNLAAMKPVDPAKATVSGQLDSLISSDSPIMQQARSRALQTMNSRGMMNSSLATGAADSAVYDTALKVAQPDASTYAAFDNNANQYNYDMGKLNAQTTAAKDVANIEAQYKNLTQGSASATSIVTKMQDALSVLSANKDITDPAIRDKAVADIKQNAADSLNLIGAMSGDLDLRNYITQVGL